MDIIELISKFIFPEPNVPGCRDCEHYQEVKSKYLAYGGCKLYKGTLRWQQMDWGTGRVSNRNLPMKCEEARENEWLCGFGGKYFRAKLSPCMEQTKD